MLKRCFDLAVALVGIVISVPIVLAAGILVIADSRGSVFFRQKRVGKDGKTFTLYKLRSMVNHAEQLGPPITSRSDPRITQIGALLRWLKIDELPQLWNVLRGDMSIVGPRPEAPEIVAGYSNEERKVLTVKPGIFGQNQIIGRNELDRYPEGVDVERYYKTVILPDKLKIDLGYVADHHFLRDLSLLFQGVWATVAGSFKLRYILEGRRRFAFLLTDACLTFISYFVAFLLRFDGEIPAYESSLFWKLAPLLLVIRIPLYIYFGLYQTLWQYAGINEIQGILKSVGLGSLVFVVLSLLGGHYTHPRSVYVIEALVTIGLLGGFRIGSKILLERLHQLPGAKARRNVLIIGAGDDGEILARELVRRPELGLWPVGFLDNDLSKRGAKIHGIQVHGDCSMIKRVADVRNAKEVIIASPALSAEETQGIFSICRQAGVRVRIAPFLRALASERFINMKIRDLKVEDLLGREEITIDTPGIYELILGKTVLVTGGGGTIGSELCRRVAEYKPKSLVIIDRSENDLYEIAFELAAANPELHIESLLIDITDTEKLKETFAKHRADIVFHAAAHKHVPLMEANVREAIKNNILGTRILADLALEFGTERFILISTDKAVNPISVMGMTKRGAELCVEVRNEEGRTRFMIVRFGNVLGSKGSVVPLLLRQIELGLPLTITDPRSERYFMGLAESVTLILQAALLGRGGEIFVLEMGQPVKIVDLANLLARYAGLSPEEVKIRYIGLRPGERLEESLVEEGEKVERTPHDKIRVILPQPFNAGQARTRVDEFIKWSAKEPSEEKLKTELQKLATSSVGDSSASSVPGQL